MSLISVVQVLDTAPTVTSAPTGPAIGVTIGAPSNYSFTVANPEGGNSTILVTWNGGTPNATDTYTGSTWPYVVSHTYGAGGPYTLTVKATDAQGSVATKTYTVTAS